MASEITNAALAAELGVSERYIYAVLKNGTTSLRLAKRIARLRGSNPQDYLRKPKRRGRKRQYPFRDFVNTAMARGGDDVDHFLMRLQLKYAMGNSETVEARRSAPPDDFEGVEALLSFLKAAGMTHKAELVRSAWKRFRIWRVEQRAAEEVAAIELEDDVS